MFCEVVHYDEQVIGYEFTIVFISILWFSGDWGIIKKYVF